MLLVISTITFVFLCVSNEKIFLSGYNSTFILFIRVIFDTYIYNIYNIYILYIYYIIIC